MKHISETTKLLASVILLFILVVFSYQKSNSSHIYKPLEVSFNTPSGPKSLLDYKNKIVLLYFGFLTCPEACPTTMSNISVAFKQLTKEELEKVVMIFVDIDPERDTLEKMQAYTSYFHPNIIPFYRNLDAVTPYARYFGVLFHKVELKSAMKYTIDHSTDIVVLSPKGEIIDEIHHGTNGNVITTTLKKLISENFKKEPK